MVAINDFCWSAFLTKSALFLKFAPLKKKTPAPLSVTYDKNVQQFKIW